MPKTKAIFFDLDETLVENQLSVSEVFGQVYHDFSNELGLENKAVFFSELRQRAQQVWSKMFEHTITPEQQLVNCFQQSIAATDAVLDERQQSMAQDMLDHFLHLSWGNVRFQDDAETVLHELNQRGYITGVITNGIELVQLGKIHSLRIDELVDHINVSAQARAHKPLRPVFDQALRSAKVSADQAWMIGDHPLNDVAGGIRAGLTGVYYNPKQHSAEKAFADLDEKPDHTVNTLAEIFLLLD